MIKVFISSPYTIGDQAVNVKRQIDCANELIELGFAPFAPLLSHFQHMIHPQEYKTWMRLNKEWLKICNCVLRLEGASKGADKEVLIAEWFDIKVFYSIDELKKYYEVE